MGAALHAHEDRQRQDILAGYGDTTRDIAPGKWLVHQWPLKSWSGVRRRGPPVVLCLLAVSHHAGLQTDPACCINALAKPLPTPDFPVASRGTYFCGIVFQDVPVFSGSSGQSHKKGCMAEMMWQARHTWNARPDTPASASATAIYLFSRTCAGVLPRYRRIAEVRWLWLENPL